MLKLSGVVVVLLLVCISGDGEGRQLPGTKSGESIEIRQTVVALETGKTVTWTLPGCGGDAAGPVYQACSVLRWDDSRKTFVWPYDVNAEHNLKVQNRWNELSRCAAASMGRFDGNGCGGYATHYANCVKAVVDSCVSTSERRFLTDQDWSSVQGSIKKLSTDDAILRTIDDLEKRVRILEQQSKKKP